MWLAGYARSIRPLILALSLGGCARGLDDFLVVDDGSSSGAGGASVGAGSGGRAPDVDANGGSGGSSSVSAGGNGGNGGDVGGGGLGSGGATVADAQSDSSSGGGGPGGGGGIVDARREATVDARADASIDAPREAGCLNPNQCALKAALVHRYSFNGTGTVATDSIGTAHGAVVNTTLSGTGSLVLAGGTQYVNLPNGIISQLTNATLEIWLNWAGGAAWQRIWDFGNAADAGAEDIQGMAATSLYLTPVGAAPDPTVAIAAFKRADQTGPMETRALSASALAGGVVVHIAVVLNDTANTMSLYRNGVLDGTPATWVDTLSLLADVNNWLGRSQYLDPNLTATLFEFRIYNVALSAAAIQESFAGGTDPLFLN